ncbi:MAG: hypothetical protein NTW25_08830 [Candidatus Kapabacteria bacterium]|nr:hypothetical protein [Candidatus Kapabacteria bacterium]
MKKYNTYLMLALLSIVLASCATTKTTSYSDPDFRGKKFNSICVYAEVEDLEMRKTLETKLADELKDNGIVTFIGIDLFPPTREWTDDQFQKTLKDIKVDGYLRVRLTNTDVRESIGNATTTTTTNGEKVKANRDNKEKYKEVSTSTTTVNRTKTFYSSFKTDLIEVASNKLAWTATSNSESGEWLGSEFNLIFGSFSSDIAKELKAKGHIR